MTIENQMTGKQQAGLVKERTHFIEPIACLALREDKAAVTSAANQLILWLREKLDSPNMGGSMR